MQDIFNQTYYGNTIVEWSVALGIAVAAFLVGKAVYWIIGAVVRRVTRDTRTALDDFLVDTVDGPVVIIVTALGLWIAVQTLTLPSGVTAFVWNAVQAALVLAVTWMLSRVWGAVVGALLAPLAAKTESDLDDQLIPIARKGGRTAIWVLGIIVALNNAGYDVAALIAGLGIGGIALAMAAKDTVSNFFGGFTIFTDQPFALGDRIVISGMDGTVSEIGIRSTRLRKLDGREVTIPNSRFADSPVENITREPSRKVVLDLGLTYDTTPEGMRRALEVLREIAEAQGENVVQDKTLVGFNGFGDFAMNVVFLYYITPGADILGVQTAVNLAILDRFNAEGLEFAFPTQTIYTLSGGAGV
jgi:MscS family membrane protein